MDLVCFFAVVVLLLRLLLGGVSWWKAPAIAGPWDSALVTTWGHLTKSPGNRWTWWLWVCLFVLFLLGGVSWWKAPAIAGPWDSAAVLSWGHRTKSPGNRWTWWPWVCLFVVLLVVGLPLWWGNLWRNFGNSRSLRKGPAPWSALIDKGDRKKRSARSTVNGQKWKKSSKFSLFLLRWPLTVAAFFLSPCIRALQGAGPLRKFR